MFGGRDQSLQLRLEAYNVFNTLNLNYTQANWNVVNVNFGRVTATRNPASLPGARLVQLGVKFMF